MVTARASSRSGQLTWLSDAHARAIGLNVAVFLAGLLGSIVISWPFVTFAFSDTLAIRDVYVSVWGLWWVPHAIGELQNPWYTDEIIAPAGSYLALHALVPLAGLLMAPVTLLAGPVVSYNLLVLVIPAVATWLVYRLGRELALPWWAAALAGVLYGLSPVITWRAGVHLNLSFGALFPPLALIFAVRLRRTGRVREAVALGVVAGLSLYADHTSALWVLIAVGSYLIGALVLGGERRRLVQGSALAAGVGLILALPLLAMTVRQLGQTPAPGSRDATELSWLLYNVDAASMLAPLPANDTFDGLGALGDLGSRYSGGEGPNVLGWGILLLAVAGVVLAARRRRVVIWLGLLALLGMTLALGPTLRIADGTYEPLGIEFENKDMSALLPYTWMVHVPPLQDFRIPARFLVLAVLALALLAGFGAAMLVRRGRWGGGIAAVLAALAILSLGQADWAEAGRVPESREALLADITADDSDSLVVDLPLVTISGTRGIGNAAFEEGLEGQLRATEHGHPIAGGFVSRLSAEAVEAEESRRFFADLLTLQGTPLTSQAPATPDPTAGAASAREEGVRWVIVWPQAGDVHTAYLARAGFEKVREADGVEVWRLRDP